MVAIIEKVTFADFLFGIRPPDWSKLSKNSKDNNDVTIFRHDTIVKFFWCCFIFLVKFSYCSTFHVNITTGSGITTILIYKGFTRNREIGNTPVWVLPNIWILGRVMDTIFGLKVSDKILLNAERSKMPGVTAFTVFELLRENQLGEWVKLSSPHPD